MRAKTYAAGLLTAVAVTGCSAQAATEPPPPAPPSSLPAPPSTTPSPTPPPPPPSPPCSVKTGACASLSLRLAWLLKDGAVVHGPVPMEPGDAAQPTPAGTFRVAWKDKVHTSSEYGDPMPNSVFFAAGGIAFHAGPLDQPSHGCIHLTDADSTVFFNGLPVGAEVQVAA
ncbi:L,D-transpeptidase [Amycolatopsis saalfeldensis]|uniref:L,D-transpeptidase catalytic domain n=1 Tax=Amycolatopsis saalfeldensis TaxID=394193 RepID=A0A1H8YF43_9PSEU|nr:L,D-transpeptidase [Amycolatopsis saalfeldensis]SEP50860.1 L,D-transpeptidase catalytic domain [Amycolatopsis saalfeldensis]